MTMKELAERGHTMSADSDMVERVARAIYAVRFCDGKSADDGWTALPPAIRDRWAMYARAALDASGIGELVEALEKCRHKFAEYAELHRAKLADTSSPAAVESIMEKVMRNREMRDLCDAALSRARATQETNSE